MSDSQDDLPPAPRVRRRTSSLALGAALGVSAGLLALLVVAVWYGRAALPVMTAESLAAAIERFDAQGPGSYNLELALSGREQGRIQLEVRDGEPTAMTRDGRTPQRRTWEYWTIPEQFAMLERELTGNVQQLFGVPDRSQVILRAEFDPQYGYPRRYQRQVLGADQEIQWEIVRFEVVE